MSPPLIVPIVLITYAKHILLSTSNKLCHSSFRKSKGKRNHNVVSITGENVDKTPNSHKCSEHNLVLFPLSGDRYQELDMFCKKDNCGVLLCAKCCVLKHNGHPIVAASEVGGILLTEMEDQQRVQRRYEESGGNHQTSGF